MTDTADDLSAKLRVSDGEHDHGDAPAYVAHRLACWERFRAARQAARERDADAGAQPQPITVTMPDGSTRAGVRHRTTPMEIAEQVSEGLALAAVVALVNGEQRDMGRPLDCDCTLEIKTFDSPEGRAVFWHSTAHMLGEALECKYGGELCIGPPVEDGFYYDMCTGGGVIHDSDFGELEQRVAKIMKDKQRTFERMEVTKQEAREMFGYNRFKCELIDKLRDDERITCYRDGPFIDLCRGPHVPVCGRVKAMKVTKSGQAYWLGNSENPSLQRVYGISFPDKKQLKEWEKRVEEAAKRDHRKIGREQELFMFHTLSPGSCFFLPHGTRIYNRLLEFIRGEYWRRGYEEVHTPNVFDFALWETSGHSANYRENMFSFEVEQREYGMKPMNCPSHCLIFAHRRRSHRELPMRLADFGVLHRNELSGTLSGLTRVRKFEQDDAHIFCAPEQVEAEVVQYLHFMKHVYDVFGFAFELELSTRPEKYIGAVELWDRAESMLERALVQFTGKQRGEPDGWTLNPGDGAFYGPKIDIKVFDALRRRHQCATVQLDFQLPVRFNLQYAAPTSSTASASESASAAEAEVEAGEQEGGGAAAAAARQGDERSDHPHAPDADADTAVHRPVIIHRAIFGSFERFFAIITEHFGGKWPLWLSPRQAIVVPVSERFAAYARAVRDRLHAAGLYVDVDGTDRKLNKKIREAQLAQYNYILVTGEKEQRDGTVNVRTRDNEVHGERAVEALVGELLVSTKRYE